MSLLKKSDYPNYTYQDYVKWEGHWELIEGIPYAMSPAPSPYHQLVSSKINALLNIALEKCPDCMALLPVDWKINDNTVVQPDNLVICYPLTNLPYIEKAPSIIFEILSESTEKKDRGIKFRIYEKQKVPYYVIVDINNKVIEIYKFIKAKYRKEILRNNIYAFLLKPCSLELDFAKIW